MLDVLYLVHHSHTDIGFTHDQDVVLDLHDQFIDQAIDLCEQTADYPAGAAMRWTCECTYPLLHWLRRRDPRQIARFLELERQGRIEVTGMFTVFSQCLAHEGTWRQLYPIGDLRNDFGLTIRSAMQCDVNGQHWGLIDALVDAGIANFSMAINENLGRAAFGATRPNGFYWQSGSNEKILTWNGLHYNSNQYFGIPDDYDRAAAQLPRFLRWLEQRDYPYSFCLFQATHNSFCDNGPPDIRLARFVRRWNAEGRRPRMEITTLDGFFERLRQEPDQRLPVHRGEWTDYWNYGAVSTTYETALNRDTYRRLAEAEWLGWAAPPDPPEARDHDLHKAWELALLFDEHTWGANVSGAQPWSLATRSQLNQKLNYAYRAHARAQLLKREAAARLARSLASTTPGRHVLLLNALPWPRQQRLQVPRTWLEGLTCPAPQMIEAENQPQPTYTREIHDTISGIQYLDRQDTGEQQDLAESDILTTAPVQVPAMGYRLCTVAELAAEIPQPPQTVANAEADNRWFTIEMDARRGGIGSFYDKQRDKQWVDRNHEYSLAALVRETIATADPSDPLASRHVICRVRDWSRFTEPPRWNPRWPARRDGIQRVVEQTRQRVPGATRLRQVCQAPGLTHLAYELTVHDEHPYVDLQVTINKTWDHMPETYYLIFPFDLSGATPRYEAVGGVVEPSTDQLPGCCQDYHTIQGWADWSDQQTGVTICTPDTPIALFGGFHFGRMHDGPRPDTPAAFLSMVMSNLYYCNYAPAQHGELSVSYRLFPHDVFDAAASSQQARESANPVWGHPVKDPTGSRPGCASLVKVDHPAIDVSACKRAEDGRGVILRLRNTSPEPARGSVSLASHLSLPSAWRCDALENPLESLAIENNTITVYLPGFATRTYRFEG